MTPTELSEKIRVENEPLFEYARVNVRHFFDNPETTKEDLIRHFTGRLSNERLNLVEVSKSIADLPLDTSPEDMILLTKQAQDEAIHFKLVNEILEHISGEEVDTGALLEEDLNNGVQDKGGYALGKYEDFGDPLALIAYQIVAEGRAAAMWQEMDEMGAVDDFVASRYARIARDEAFHATIGLKRLGDLELTDEEQERVLEYVDEIRFAMYECQVTNKSFSIEAPGSADIIQEAYGWSRDQVVN